LVSSQNLKSVLLKRDSPQKWILVRAFGHFPFHGIATTMRALLLLLAFAQTSGLRMRALRMGVTSVQNDEFFANHPESLRIFHPAFPLSILQPIPAQEAESIARVKKLINPDASSAQKDHQRLPWLTFPKIGVPDAQKFLSKREVLELYDKNRHLGEFVW
jgi:hypothetical protein